MAAAALVPLAACTPTDTSADTLVEELTAALSRLSLDDISLVNPEATGVFAEHAAPLADFDVVVTAGEVDYDVSEAKVPLTWEWTIEDQPWTYDTSVDLIWEESQWWVAWQPEAFIPDLGAGQQIGVDSREAERAEILAGDGEVIVTERPVLRYGLDKTRVAEEELEAVAPGIARAAGVDEEAFTARVLAAGPKAFVEAITVRPEDADELIEPDFRELPGALVVNATMLLGPTRTFARELLGRAGEATAEIIEDSDGQISQGDIVGISGLQAQYDNQLRGAPAIEIFLVDTATCPEPLECEANERRVLTTIDATPPTDLHLTLDIDTQIAAEEALGALEGGPASALVAIKPSTGEILALANGEGNGGLNHAAVGQYPPGSTFKVVTALALLRAGVGVDDLVDCPPTINVAGREFKNYDEYPTGSLGEISFTSAFAHSCNTALIGLRDKLPGDALPRAAEALGLGDSPQEGFPAFFGDVPAPQDGTDGAAAVIGQGRTLVSPLAMATVAASVAAGTTVVPHLFHGEDLTPEVAAPLTEEEAATLQMLMRAVVTDGTATLLNDVPGEPVLAKTGTAEAGTEAEDPHAWMIASQGDLAAAVFVGAGIGGAETAGPVLKDFLARLPR